MKSMSFPISDAWLIKVATCLIITQVFGLKDEIADSRLLYVVLNALALPEIPVVDAPFPVLVGN